MNNFWEEIQNNYKFYREKNLENKFFIGNIRNDLEIIFNNFAYKHNLRIEISRDSIYQILTISNKVGNLETTNEMKISDINNTNLADKKKNVKLYFSLSLRPLLRFTTDLEKNDGFFIFIDRNDQITITKIDNIIENNMEDIDYFKDIKKVISDMNIISRKNNLLRVSSGLLFRIENNNDDAHKKFDEEIQNMLNLDSKFI